jgi:hypothetical protein
MPGEAVPTDAAADEKFAAEDKFYKQYWETRVLQKTASKDKWAVKILASLSCSLVRLGHVQMI